jgi:hypothetical protein
MFTPINIVERPPVLFLWWPIGGTVYFQLQVLRVRQRRVDRDGNNEVAWSHRDGAAVSGLLDPGLKRDGHLSGGRLGFDRFCGKRFGGIERADRMLFC